MRVYNAGGAVSSARPLLSSAITILICKTAIAEYFRYQGIKITKAFIRRVANDDSPVITQIKRIDPHVRSALSVLHTLHTLQSDRQ